MEEVGGWSWSARFHTDVQNSGFFLLRKRYTQTPLDIHILLYVRCVSTYSAFYYEHR